LSLEDFFDALRFGLPRPPALAHRLDKETSGCLVLGRHRKALAHLGLLFKHGKVGKTYWAVVEGGPDADSGVIDLPLGRLDQTRGWWMKPDLQGQPAMTRWTVLGRASFVADTPVGMNNLSSPSQKMWQPPPPLRGRVGEGGILGDSTTDELPPSRPAAGRSTSLSRGEVKDKEAATSGEAATCGEAVTSGDKGAPDVQNSDEPRPKRLTWLALEPLTGRTHQLRVHCAAMGWPIVGDNIYGDAPRFDGPGLHLHAREIIIPLGRNKEPAQITAPVPAHMRDLLMACGFTAESEFLLSAAP
jgi:tRNA pseudouridine32 synthase/23S rRNA pseudouridine746 synthase